MGVQSDIEVVGILGDIGAGNHPVGVVGQYPGRVGGQVSVPQHVGGGPHQFGGVGHRAGVGGLGGAQAAGGLGGSLTAGAQGVDDGGFEASQQLSDRLVNGGDSGHGDRAGNDTHLVGGVTRVLGLPQRVGAPPAQNVGVKHGHEGHRLGVLAAQVDEPGGVGGLHFGGGGRRIALRQGRQGRVGIQDVVLTGEQGGNFTVVGVAQARLNAVQQIEEPVVPTLIGPIVAARSAAGVRGHAKLRVAGGPLQVTHVLDVAEVGLGGFGQSGDHLLTARSHGGVVTGQFLDQTRGAGGGVVDLVQICPQVGQTGGHASGGGAGGDPAALVGGVDAGSVNQQLLDVLVGLGLQAGHGGGADAHSVDGGGRSAVSLGPAPGDVVGGPLRRTDAAAHTQHDVVHRTNGVVGGQEHGVQVLPRVVSASVTILDLHDHRHIRHRLGDGDHLPDLVYGAGFEGHVGEALATQAVNQGDRLVQLGNTRRDDHTVHRGAGGTRLGQQSLGAQMQVPQVAVHEHGVKGGGAARFEGLLQTGQIVGQHLSGGLTAAGQLRPVARIGGGGDDLRVHGGRRHPGQQNGGAAGQAGEGRVERDAPVGQLCQAGRETGPVHGGNRGGAGPVEVVDITSRARWHHGDSGAGDHGLGQSGQHRARTEVNNDTAGGLSRAERGRDRGRPVDRVDEHVGGQLAGQVLIQVGPSSPSDHIIDGAGQQRGVEGHRGGQELGDRAQDRTSPAPVLAVPLGAASSGLKRGHDPLQVGWAAGQNMRQTPVNHADGDPLGVGHPRQHAVEDLASHPAHGQHGGGLPHGAEVEATGSTGGRGADQAGDGVNLYDRVGHGDLFRLLARAALRLKQADTEYTLGMADHGARGVLAGRVDARTGETGQHGVLGE